MERAREASKEIEESTARIKALRQVRIDAMAEAVADGYSYADLARELGISLARVNQLLGGQYVRPTRGGVGTPSKGVKGAKAPRGGASKQVKPRKPEEHRHRYDSVGWNHRRGGYLVAQRCECGDARVIPAGHLPAQLRDVAPDTRISA